MTGINTVLGRISPHDPGFSLMREPVMVTTSGLDTHALRGQPEAILRWRLKPGLRESIDPLIIGTGSPTAFESD